MIFTESAGLQRPFSCKPVQDLVPSAGEREEPGAAIVEAERGVGEGDLRERVFVTARISVVGLQNGLRNFVAEVGGHCYSVTGVAEREVKAVELAGVGHDVEREIERAAPDVFDFRVAQFGIDGEHAAAKNFRAAANGAACLGEERGSAAEEHATVGRESVVVEIVFGVE